MFNILLAIHIIHDSKIMKNKKKAYMYFDTNPQPQTHSLFPSDFSLHTDTNTHTGARGKCA